MTTIEEVDFKPPRLLRMVEPCLQEVPMATIQIMSVVGSAVPASLREQGLLACWYLVRNGEAVSGPMPSRASAQALIEQLQPGTLVA